MMRVCQREGCDEPILTSHPRAKWCSGRCRRIVSHTSKHQCTDCGGPVGQGGNIARRCRDCQKVEWKRQHNEHVLKVQAMWNEGLKAREIAERMGWANALSAMAQIGRYRQQGYEFPIRNHGLHAAMKDGWSDGSRR